MFVDIHTHKLAVLGIPGILNLPFDEAEAVFSSNQNGFYSLGIHPRELNTTVEFNLSAMENFAGDHRLLAIGECGLDKNATVPVEFQIEIFKKHILLAEHVQKPMILHCVGCFNELFALKKEMKPLQLWIIHGFRGKPELAQQALKAGCSLSFGEHFNPESVLLTPPDKLYAETDQSNMSIEEIYKMLANIKEIEPRELIAGYTLWQKLTGFEN